MSEGEDVRVVAGEKSPSSGKYAYEDGVRVRSLSVRPGGLRGRVRETGAKGFSDEKRTER